MKISGGASPKTTFVIHVAHPGAPQTLLHAHLTIEGNQR